MPFIIARVLNYYEGTAGQAKIIRAAQVKTGESEANITWFDTDDCELQFAGHYNAAGLIRIGERFAKGYRQIMDKTDMGKHERKH